MLMAAKKASREMKFSSSVTSFALWKIGVIQQLALVAIMVQNRLENATNHYPKVDQQEIAFSRYLQLLKHSWFRIKSSILYSCFPSVEEHREDMARQIQGPFLP